jgi:DNA repair protein RadC
MVSQKKPTETELQLCLTAKVTIMIGHSNYAGEVRVSYCRDSHFQDIGSIQNPSHVFSKLTNILDMQFGSIENREVAFAIFLNRANRIIGWSVLATGDLVGVIMSTYDIAKQCLLTNASGVIIAHNHPSGNLTPSEPDKKITKEVKEGLKTLSINLVDHLIITREGYYSFSEEGLL